MATALNNVEIFLVNVVLETFLYVILLRFFLQWVKVDFYNPLCQIVSHITDPFLKPLRKIIPGLFGLDLASLVLGYIVSSLIIIVVSVLVIGVSAISWNTIWFIAIIKLLLATTNLYVWLITLKTISNWFTRGAYNLVDITLNQLTEPLLSRVRKILPSTKSGFDFSPMIVILFICIQIFTSSLIPI
jgi:YggT family protein